MIKSRRIRSGLWQRKEKRKMSSGFWWGNLKEQPGLDGRVKLAGTYKNSMRRCELDLSGIRQKSVADPSEHGNEYSGSIKGGEFFDSLKTC
jgi:hypothetical protein